MNQWLKQAVLLTFRLTDIRADGRRRAPVAYDKVPLKFAGWGDEPLQGGRLPRRAGRRGAALRLYRAGRRADAELREPRRLCRTQHHGGHLGDRRLLRADRQELHISGGVGIGGVLEPLQANPVIIEDDCFIGARSEVAEGVIVERGSVLSMGVFIGASTKIIDRATGEVYVGRVPAYSVVVPGSAAGQAAAGRLAGAEPLLRRHREEGGRADPLQDLASTNCCATERRSGAVRPTCRIRCRWPRR